MNIVKTLTVILMLAGHSVKAEAHKVNIFAYAEGNSVYMQGYFSDGKKPMNCDVTVYDSAGLEVLKGKTNDQGEFSFQAPKHDDLRIVLNAGQGHQSEFTIPKGDLENVKVTAPQQSKPAAASPSTVVTGTATTVAQVSSEAAMQSITEEQLRQAIGLSIRPVMRSLSEMKEQRSLSDIIGGVGLIMGLGGLFFFLKARKLMEKKQ